MSDQITIADLVPHAGAMVLLDEVISYGAEHIHCRTQLQDLHQHPLAQSGVLPATALAELAGQAMAVHGSLIDSAARTPRAGQLVALARLELHIDAINQALMLDIHAQWLAGDERGTAYEFQVKNGDLLLAAGRATIMFNNQENR